MDKKMKLKEKILIIFLIIFSVLGIAYEVFAVFKYFDNAQPEYYYEPPWVAVAESTTSDALKSGVVTEKGGNSKDAEEVKDSGSRAVGVDSGGLGGSAGASGEWKGSIEFDLETEIFSKGSTYVPRNVDGMSGIIWFEDLCNIKEVLCTAHGLPITGESNYVEDKKSDGSYWAHDVSPESINPRNPRTYDWLETLNQIRSIANGDVEFEEYQKYYRTPCEYTGTEKQANPAEAFVLSESDRVTGNTEKTPLQVAWWYIHDQSDETNSLAQAATAFQTYVDGAEQDGPTDVTSTTGEEHSNAFPIKYEPVFEDPEKSYKVYFDEAEQKWIVGPFKINYYQCEPFAFMNNLQIFINDSREELDKEKFELVDSEKLEKLVDDEKPEKPDRYPNDGEEFYIKINFDEKIVKVVDMKATFQYMNATAKYTLYTGDYQNVYVQGHIFGEFDPDKVEMLRQALLDISDALRNNYAITVNAAEGMGGFGYITSGATSNEILNLLSRAAESWESWNMERRIPRK